MGKAMVLGDSTLKVMGNKVIKDSREDIKTTEPTLSINHIRKA